MIVALRAGISLALLLPLVVLVPRFRLQPMTRPWLHLWRGALIGFATHLGFYTLTQIPLATAAVLFFTAPIFATALSVLVHKEPVGPRRWSAVGTGFVGALIILRPDTGLHPAMLAALLSSALFAIALTMSRGLAEADGAGMVYVSSVVVTLVISIPLAAPVASLPSGGGAWALFAVVVVGGVVRGYADIEAYRYGEAAILAPITYLRLVLIGIGGYLFFAEVPDSATYIGATIIVLATLYIARREARLKRRARAARSG
jgi:drug/metabolite transporter (DMT)-like permease